MFETWLMMSVNSAAAGSQRQSIIQNSNQCRQVDVSILHEGMNEKCTTKKTAVEGIKKYYTKMVWDILNVRIMLTWLESHNHGVKRMGHPHSKTWRHSINRKKHKSTFIHNRHSTAEYIDVNLQCVTCSAVIPCILVQTSQWTGEWLR